MFLLSIECSEDKPEGLITFLMNLGTTLSKTPVVKSETSMEELLARMPDLSNCSEIIFWLCVFNVWEETSLLLVPTSKSCPGDTVLEFPSLVRLWVIVLLGAITETLAL